MADESKQAGLVASLVATHGEQLRRFLASRVRNSSDISDIVQEVFLRMLRVPNSETIRSPEAYLFVVARHVAQQHALRQATAPISVELRDMLIEAQCAVEIDPQLEASAQESLRELDRALDQLSPKARATFLFHRRDGMTLEEIGNRLGVSRPQVKKYLAKALLHFRKTLQAAE